MKHIHSWIYDDTSGRYCEICQIPYVKKADSIALVSGGVDSVVMLHYIVKNWRRSPGILLFDYNQRSMKEADCAKYHARLLGLECIRMKLELPKAQFVQKDNYNTYIPVRNMVFLSIAASVAEDRGVRMLYTGFHDERADMFWDTTPEFKERMNSVLQLNDRDLMIIESPLEQFRKAEIIKLGLKLGVDFSRTWSCYENREKACGKCPICIVRLRNFHKAGIEDPLEYEDRSEELLQP